MIGPEKTFNVFRLSLRALLGPQGFSHPQAHISPTQIRRTIIDIQNRRRFFLAIIALILCGILNMPASSFVVAAAFVVFSFTIIVVGLVKRSKAKLFIVSSLIDTVFVSIIYGLSPPELLPRLVLFLLYFPLLNVAIPVLMEYLGFAIALFGICGLVLADLLNQRVDHSTLALASIMVLTAIANSSLIRLLRSGFLQAASFFRSIKARRDEQAQQSQQKAEYLAHINHELRTPLNGILGMTTLLVDSPLLPDQQEFARTIKSSAELLLSLINDILDMSRIDAGYLQLERRSFALHSLFDLVRDNLKLAASDKGVKLELVYDSTVPPHVVGDSARMSQILFNLVGNAVKFTSRGAVSIHVQAIPKKEQPGRCDLIIKVSDTGIGVPAEFIPHLFDKYRQESAEIQKRYGGTGLGLSITRELIVRMNGDISVSSVPQKGSVFLVTIPLVYEEPHQFWKRPKESDHQFLPFESEPSSNYSGQETMKHKNLVVLIADDNGVNLRLMGRMVDKAGLSHEEFVSGADAFEAMKRLKSENRLGLAILDYQMPGLDGMEVAIMFREWEALSNQKSSPLCILTGHGPQKIGTFKLSHYHIDFMEKPVRMEDLHKYLHSKMENGSLSSAE